MNAAYDIAVIGSGFAGSLTAMVARRLGYSVVLIEKDAHPRVVIGESSTPLSNLLLEELADTYDLPMLKPLTKWGSWQKTYPAISCGLKRGFSFFHHDLSCAKHVDQTENQLFVEASPHNGIADTHWFRSEFDQFLVSQAQALDITYIDRFTVDGACRNQDSWTLSGRRSSISFSIDAGYLIDATGPRGFLHRTLRLQETALTDYPSTSSLYCHFTGVQRLVDPQYRNFSRVPFPVDDAAVHHVFEGGWIWVLRFNNGWTSAGISATEALSRRFRLDEGHAGWNRLLDSLPLLKQQFATAMPVTPFTYLPKTSFRSETIIGDGWALLPAAAGFIDPLLSTGFPLTLLGIQRLGRVLAERGPVRSLSDRLANYAEQTRLEHLTTAKLIGSLYKSMGNFSVFHNLSMLYFAAASYSETARRLGKPEIANSFLLSTDAGFAPALDRILTLAAHDLCASQQDELEAAVYSLIAQYDVAGLCKRRASKCYPVAAEDLYAAAHLFGATDSQLQQLLHRSGFYNVPNDEH